MLNGSSRLLCCFAPVFPASSTALPSPPPPRERVGARKRCSTAFFLGLMNSKALSRDPKRSGPLSCSACPPGCRWYAANSEALWGAEKPTMEQCRDHAKCLRSLPELQVRECCVFLCVRLQLRVRWN